MARKRKLPSLNADSWAGTIIKTEGVVEKTISQEKWNRVKAILLELRANAGSRDHPLKLEHKFLERSRGFLNHIALIYTYILPYLKGHHTTINS